MNNLQQQEDNVEVLAIVSGDIMYLDYRSWRPKTKTVERRNRKESDQIQLLLPMELYDAAIARLCNKSKK